MSEEASSKEMRRARTIAWRLLKIRGRSEEELRGRLRLKEIPTDTAEKVIEHLKNAKLLDDRRFAKDWISARLCRPFGLRRISLELKKKGVSPDMIKEEIRKVEMDYEESGIVETLAQKRALKYAQMDRQKKQKRVFDYLARRGFSLESIQKAVHKL